MNNHGKSNLAFFLKRAVPVEMGIDLPFPFILHSIQRKYLPMMMGPEKLFFSQVKLNSTKINPLCFRRWQVVDSLIFIADSLLGYFYDDLL